MSLLMIEGFEWLDNAVTRTNIQAELRKYYRSVDVGSGAGAALAATRTGMYGLSLQNGHSFFTGKLKAPTTNTTAIIGFYAKMPASFSANSAFVRIYSGSTVQIEMEMNSDGTVEFFRGTATSLGTSVFAFTGGNEYYIELKVVFNDSTGSITLNVADVTSDEDAETTQEYTLSSIDTINTTRADQAGWDEVRFESVGSDTVLDDIYICDNGGTKNNDFLDNQIVETIEADSAGDLTQLTPSAGSNFQNVDEVSPPDDDTTYNTADADGETDLYNFGSLSNTGAIAGIQVSADVRVTSGNPRKIRLPVKSSATTSEGSDLTILNDAYTAKKRILEQDPNGSMDWGVSAVNALQAGIKRQS